MTHRLATRAFVFLAAAVVLTSCASQSPEVASSPASEPAISEMPQPDGDAEALARAQAWLDAARLPDGAVHSESVPATSVGFQNEFYQWPCQPMEELTAYWTMDGASVADTAAWLSENPTADLILPIPFFEPSDDADILSVGNVPANDSLEGIVYTVAKTQSGVAIRALIGAIPENAVCPTPVPGGRIGQPGEG